jgi:hypothetical protein
VTARELRALVHPRFEILKVTSVKPDGDRGILRLVNAPKLNSLAAHVVSPSRLERWKERALLGDTIMLLARVRG